MCFDGVKRLCHIRGKLRKKVWINTGDIVLVGLREYQDSKADVILKYTPDEARKLMALNEIPNTTKINEEEGGDDVIFFEDDDGGVNASGSESDEEGYSRSGGIPVAKQHALAGMLPSSESEDDDEDDEEEGYQYQNYDKPNAPTKGGIDIDKI